MSLSYLRLSGLSAMLVACGSEPSEIDTTDDPALCAATVPSCAPPGLSECDRSATPDFTGKVSEPTSFLAEVPYGNESCPGRFVYEIEVDQTESAPGESPLWTSAVWDVSVIDTEDECAAITLFVAIERELTDGTWEPWDAYRVVGDFTSSGCETVFCGGGKLADGTRNDYTGFPYTWVDIADANRVRVVVSGYDSDCEQELVMLGAVRSPN